MLTLSLLCRIEVDEIQNQVLVRIKHREKNSSKNESKTRSQMKCIHRKFENKSNP
jgi:hypothetical protein